MAGSSCRSRSARLYQSSAAAPARANAASSSSIPPKQSSVFTKLVVAGAIGGAVYYCREHLPLDILKKEVASVAGAALTDAQVEALLSADSNSVLGSKDSIVVRCDTASLASTSGEDRTAAASFVLPGNRHATLFVVLDGHGGDKCVEIVQKHLGAYVARAVYDATNTWFAVKDRQAIVSAAIKTAFERLDNDILNGAFLEITPNTKESVEDQKAKFAAQIRQAVAGSCALVALVDGSDLYVAATGDTRAILGSRNDDGTFATIQMSEDQRPDNLKERKRILAEHPHEKESDLLKPYTDVVNYGPDDRVLGYLAVTRAFGDAQFKWASDILAALPTGSTRKTIEGSVSPPYLTASPVVTHRTITPNKDMFLVMATDGLTDELKSTEAVSIVNGFLQNHGVAAASTNKTWGMDPFALGLGKWNLRTDTNAATSLIRNALGGNSKTVGELLQKPEERDDMTVKVVFFGDNRKVKETVEGVDLNKLVETAPVSEPAKKFDAIDWNLATKRTQLLPRWTKWLAANQ
ncbi:hypothetical protein HDU79_009721 [Rhizoclosmatium sp. JEL0117]|nr:hypothetical protein HDU79_009721 [Rhizoclosmatium sp. JEL0117]